jgi:hypothetical protein
MRAGRGVDLKAELSGERGEKIESLEGVHYLRKMGRHVIEVRADQVVL